MMVCFEVTDEVESGQCQWKRTKVSLYFHWHVNRIMKEELKAEVLQEKTGRQ